MAMYAIGIMPLINHLQSSGPKQTWFADDATACGNINDLLQWYTNIKKHGTLFGYFVNPSKSWLIVKKEHLTIAKQAFEGSGINITVEGKHHLGAVIGSKAFIKEYVEDKIQEWVSDVITLAKFAKTQPHAAYAAYKHGLSSKWTYFYRTIPAISDMLHPLEETITNILIPALTGRSSISGLERELLALPPRLGGLGISIPSVEAALQHCYSLKVTAPIVAKIIAQNHDFSYEDICMHLTAKIEVKKAKKQHQDETANDLKCQLPAHLARAMEFGSEKGASSWLSVVPIKDHGFALHKGEFQDALCLRYNWHPPKLPTTCVCKKSFTINHALNCPTGGFPIIRHNEFKRLHSCTDV